MSLKPQPDRPVIVVPAPPTWGVLAESGEEVSSIRFECADSTYSYPYHALARWVLALGEPESLLIQAGKDTVTVQGRQLTTIRDALETGRLRILRSADGRYAGTRSGPIVTHLVVASATPE